MKKLFILLAITALYLPSLAETIKLSWCPSTDPAISGYKIYYVATNKISGWKGQTVSNGTNCPPVITSTGTNWVRNYNASVVIDGRVSTGAISNAVVGKTYYVSITSIGTNGLESGFANEVECTISNTPPSIPQNFQLIDVK